MVWDDADANNREGFVFQLVNDILLKKPNKKEQLSHFKKQNWYVSGSNHQIVVYEEISFLNPNSMLAISVGFILYKY